jgi:hypothetical protein
VPGSFRAYLHESRQEEDHHHYTTPHPFASNQQSSVAEDIKSSGLIQVYIVSIRNLSVIISPRHDTTPIGLQTTLAIPEVPMSDCAKCKGEPQNKTKQAACCMMALHGEAKVDPSDMWEMGFYRGLHMTLECRDTKLWPISKCVTMSGASQCICLCSDSGQSE